MAKIRNIYASRATREARARVIAQESELSLKEARQGLEDAWAMGLLGRDRYMWPLTVKDTKELLALNGLGIPRVIS